MAASQEFLESLYAAGAHLAGKPGDFVRFRAIYDIFCLAPGYKKDNPPTAFAQQVYALQRSGLRTTRSGSRIEIEGPSGSYKERDIFSVIAEDGRPIRYYGVYFK